MQARVGPDVDLPEIPSSPKRKQAKDHSGQVSSRNEGIYRAYQSGGYSMKAIADAKGLHYFSMSEVIKSYENSRFKI